VTNENLGFGELGRRPINWSWGAYLVFTTV